MCRPRAALPIDCGSARRQKVYLSPIVSTQLDTKGIALVFGSNYSTASKHLLAPNTSLVPLEKDKYQGHTTGIDTTHGTETDTWVQRLITNFLKKDSPSFAPSLSFKTFLM